MSRVSYEESGSRGRLATESESEWIESDKVVDVGDWQ